MLLLTLLFACRSTPSGPTPLTAEQVTAYVRSDADDRAAWGAAVRSALVLAERPVDESQVCQVLAVIEQESGYAADPEVPGLAAIAEQEITAELSSKLGFLGDDVVDMILDVTPDGGQQTFRQQLHAVRTERDLDRLFQDIVAHHEAKAPAVGKAVRMVFPNLVERLNPVSTAGSMQVKVGWAQDHPVSRGMDDSAVRASMYTLEGGVRYGTLRLFATADYDEPIHRFADFNAGPFASRNAAVQSQLSKLSGRELVRDGDLVAYNDRGRARRRQEGETYTTAVTWAGPRGLSENQVFRDLVLEKTPDLESTATWELLKDAYRTEHGEPDYAEVPRVTLDSPKLKGEWTTESFARRVQRRYDDCRSRA